MSDQELVEALNQTKGVVVKHILKLESEAKQQAEHIAELENIMAYGAHTCNSNCQRPMCVLRRENDALRATIAEAKRIASAEPKDKAILAVLEGKQ